MTLTAAWLRQRFGSEIPVETASEAPPNGETLIAAAVLVPIVLRQPDPTVLLTLRTAHLRDHAGQVSFPGGRQEATDESPVMTALREAHEEVGLEPSQIEVLGSLAEFHTSTGFVVTPVVGLVTPPLNLKLDDFEVDDVFEPPLAFLLDPANFRRERVEYQGALREYWAVPWQERYIWGATAGMLVKLHEFLFGRL
jgi:8-oxo-dGTP pyrophosphatase MutT (NUDIX family)